MVVLLPPEAIERLTANDASLTVLDLSNNSTIAMSPDETAIAIAKALENNTHLIELDLSGNSISTAGASALAEVLKNPNCPIQKLNLSVNKIDHAGLTAIAEAIKTNKKLVELNLLDQGREPGDALLTSFIEAFEYNTTLLNIIWRLNSRKSFKINSLITRNNEIKRRLGLGKSVDDIDPNIRRETEARILAERAEGLPKFVAPEPEPEPTEAPEATGGPYTLKVLKAKLLPADVDPTKKEEYLSDDEFKEVFGEARDSFVKSPAWKRKKKKEDLGLF